MSVPRTLSGQFRDSGLRLASMVVDSSVATVKAVLGRLNRSTPFAAAAPLLGARDDDESDEDDLGYEAYESAPDGYYLDGPSDCPNDSQLRVSVAASFVRDAMHGRNPNRRTTRATLATYTWYHSRTGQALRYGATFALIFFPLFEQPGWCARADCTSEEAARYWWAAERWPAPVSSGLELLSLAVITLDLVARMHFTGWREFKREWWTSSRAAVVALTVADVLCCSLPGLGWRRTGLTRLLRIYVFLTQHHSLRVACVNIFRTMPALTEVLLILSGAVLLTAWAATLLFKAVPGSNFASFPEALLLVYTLSTVTNFPAVTIPVFRVHPLGFLFFVSFLCVGVLLLMNLTLAIVYEAHRINLAVEVREQLTRQRRALRRAFDSLAVPVDGDSAGLRLPTAGLPAAGPPEQRKRLPRTGERSGAEPGGATPPLPRTPERRSCAESDGALGEAESLQPSPSWGACRLAPSASASASLLLPPALLPPPAAPAEPARGYEASARARTTRGLRLGAWCALLRELSPGLRQWQAEMLFHGCDADGRGHLEVHAWNKVLLALQLRFEPVASRGDERLRLLLGCEPEGAGPAGHSGQSAWRERLGAVVLDRRTGHCCDALALVTAVAVAWPERDVALLVHVGLVAAFALEMGAKLLVLGPRAYLRSTRTRLDGLVVLVAVGALACNLASMRAGAVYGEAAVRWTLYVWIFRALRLLTLSRRFLLLAHTLRRLRAPVLTFMGVLFCFLYGSAALGVELFGGRLYQGAACLAGSEYAAAGYEPINFNSLASALPLAFTLLMVNDFGIFLNATAHCTSPWARGYFVLFHLCNVVVVSNLLTSFILEATLRAWADVDADSADGGSAGSAPASGQGRAKRGLPVSAGAHPDAEHAASAAAAGARPGGGRDSSTTSSLVLDQRAAYLHRMQMRVTADRVTLEDGSAFMIHRADSFTGLAAMEELLEK